MRRNFLYVCVIAIAGLILCADSAHAQTTAFGPYYATPSWDQTLACATAANCPRFIVLTNFNNEAVLDRETGLVWERSPGQTDALFNACVQRNVGGRGGWRAPDVQELRSLVDSSQSNPSLPAGHPFLGVRFEGGFIPDFYWTSTQVRNADRLFVVGFSSGFTSNVSPDFPVGIRIWCVRGGQGAQVQ